MPQLDLATFFSQYIWLMVFYLGFYLLLVHSFLPRMARILKVRAAMIGAATADTHAPSTAEHSSVASVKGAKNALAQGFADLGTWVTATKAALSSSAQNDAYVTLLQENAKVHALVQKDVKALLPLYAHSSLDAPLVTGAGLHKFHTKTLLAVSTRKAKKK
jgi:hypothetical protein